jgi:hypothetical protein
LNVTILLVGADFLWRFYGGILRYRGISWFVAISFTPTMVVLEMGQITPLILLGLIGFLYFEKQGRDSLAGACLALVAIKPHLAYLVGLAILVWVVERRRWSILLGAGVTFLVATAIPFACNPSVVSQYLHSLTQHPPPILGHRPLERSFESSSARRSFGFSLYRCSWDWVGSRGIGCAGVGPGNGASNCRCCYWLPI